MNTRIRIALLLAVSTLACQDFRDVEIDGVCGNFVVEPSRGEDCDSFPASGQTLCGRPGDENACRYLCSRSNAPSCPEGWACGLEGVCVASSGTFVPESSIAYFVRPTAVQAADFDGDGRADLVGRASSDLIVRFGDARASFERTLTFSADDLSGVAIAAPVDDDLISDIVIPETRGVLIALGGGGRGFFPKPYPQSGTIASWVKPLLVGVAADPRRTPLLLVPSSSDTTARLLDRRPCPGIAGSELCTVGEIDLGFSLSSAPAAIALGELDRSASVRGDELVIAASDGEEIRVGSLECQSLNRNLSCTLRPRSRVPLPVNAHLTEGALFVGDLDGDGANDLIAGLAFTGTGRAVGTAFGDGSGGLREFRIESAFPPDGLGRVDPLAVADLDGDRRVDFVTRSGVYLTTTASPLALATVATVRAGSTWSFAAVSDMNGDGILDIAAAGEDEPGIEVLIGAGRGRFNPFRVATRQGTKRLVTADFDGDLLSDVAIVQGEELWIAFGDRSGAPDAALPMSRLQSADALLAWTSPDQLDAIADLLVVSDPGPDGARDVLVLSGSSQRQMLAPLALPDANELRSPRFVAVGRFTLGSAASDLLAITAPSSGLDSSLASIWHLPDAARAKPLEGAREVLSSCAPSITPEGALSTVADFDRDGADELVLVEGSTERTIAGSADPKPLYLNLVTERCERLEASSLYGASRAEAADLDRDGRLDLVVSYAGRAGASVYFGGAGDLPLVQRPVSLEIDGETVIAAASVNADSDLDRELAILSNNGLFVTELDASRRLVSLHRVELKAQEGSALRSMDANGDGLEDLIVASGEQLFVFLQRPCLAEDTAKGTCARKEPE
jgi:hypothetical protein